MLALTKSLVLLGFHIPICNHVTRTINVSVKTMSPTSHVDDLELEN